MALLDDRGVSEEISVAVLVVLTVGVTASVGIGVLVADSQGTNELGAEFSFEYFSERQALLITYQEGENISASDVVIQGQSKVTWAELAGSSGSATLSPGDAVQLSEGNAYGATVTEDTTISIRYVKGQNNTQLATWSGG